MAKVIPKSACLSHTVIKKPCARECVQDKRLSWRFYSVDFDGPWGLANLIDPFTFTLKDSLLEWCLDNKQDKLAEALYSLNYKEFNSISHFWKEVEKLYESSIPMPIVIEINEQLKSSLFKEKIFPKIIEFEKDSWDEICRQTFGKEAKSKHHFIATSEFSPDAIHRLKELKRTDIDGLFSLRLDGKTRIFGKRVTNIFEIWWVTFDHDICLSHKK